MVKKESTLSGFLVFIVMALFISGCVASYSYDNGTYCGQGMYYNPDTGTCKPASNKNDENNDQDSFVTTSGLNGIWNINVGDDFTDTWILVQEDNNISVTYGPQFSGLINDKSIEMICENNKGVVLKINATLSDFDNISGTIFTPGGYSNNIIGKKKSSETKLPTITVPIADINIDGDVSDWASVNVLIDDNSGPTLTIPGSDIEYVKLALNSDRTRLNILLKVTDSISTGIRYRLLFDNDMDYEISNEPNDRTVDFEWLGSSWNVVSEGNSGDDFFKVDEDGKVASNGSYIEGSVSIDKLGLKDEFWFFGSTMMGQTTYDNFHLFGTVKIK
jgi:hypothetical protein